MTVFSPLNLFFYGEGEALVVRLVIGTLKDSYMVSTVEKFSDYSDFITEHRETGNAFYLVGRKYPDTDVEVTGIKLESEDSLKRGGGAKRKNKEKSEMDESTAKKSSDRARVKVRRLLLSFSADRMMTLTFKENITDIDEAWKVLKQFHKKMSLRYGENYKFVVVPEYQKRGAVHFHLAIRGFYHVKTVRAIWRNCSGHRGGNIDITKPRKAGKNSWNPKRIAAYLSKYITKGDTVSFNRKRYAASRNITVPEPIRGWLPLGIPPLYAIELLIERMTRKDVDTRFEFNGYYPIIYLST
jgi:hypothetical protein